MSLATTIWLRGEDYILRVSFLILCCGLFCWSVAGEPFCRFLTCLSRPSRREQECCQTNFCPSDSLDYSIPHELPDQSGVPHPHNIFAVLMDIITPLSYYRASMFSSSYMAKKLDRVKVSWSSPPLVLVEETMLYSEESE